MTTLLTHEWLAVAGGSENVFEQLRAAFPDARSFCLWNDDPTRFPDVEESMLARNWLRGRKAMSLPVMPHVWKSLDLRGVSQVIASSHAFGHHAAERAAAAGIPATAYVHTPARYIWSPELDSRGKSPLALAGRRFLRRVDRANTTCKVSYIANSNFVAARIRSAWDQPATVIYPPVDTRAIRENLERPLLSDPDAQILAGLPEEFILGASRLVKYKRLDSAIDVGGLLKLPVVIAGEGPDRERLEQAAVSAEVPVTFLGRVSTPLLHQLLAKALLFAFLAVEDFGILPVEALAAGTPVLLNSTGGAKESIAVVGGGRTADPDDRSELKAAAEAAISLDMQEVRKNIDAFSNEAFARNIRRATEHSSE